MKKVVRSLVVPLLLVALLSLAVGCKAEDLGIGKSAFGDQPTPIATTAAAAPMQNPTASTVAAARIAAQNTGKEAVDFVDGKVKLLPPGFPGLNSDCSRSGLYTLQITEKCEWWDVPAKAYEIVWGTWNHTKEEAFWLGVWGGIDTNTDPDNATNTSICIAPPGTDIYPYLAGILEKIKANPNNFGGWAGRTQANLAKPVWVSSNFPEYEKVKEYLARGDKK